MNIGETWPSIVDHPLHCAMCLVHKILNIGETQPSNSGRLMHSINILLCCTDWHQRIPKKSNIHNFSFPYGCYTVCSNGYAGHHHRVGFFIALSIAFDCLIKSEEGSTMGSHHATWDEMEVTRQINRSHILTKQPILESFSWLCWWSYMTWRKIACDEYLDVK